jgi:Holliday junction resolvase
VSNPSKNKGSRAEREAAAIWAEETGVPARRALGAGRKDDVGDIYGIPNTVCQVASIARLNEAIRLKPVAAEQQRLNAGVDFACTFVRMVGGEFRVVLTTSQWFQLWRAAQ